MNRRDFLVASSAGIVALPILTAMGATASAEPVMSSELPGSAVHATLEIEGVDAGPLKGFEGGNPYGVVAESKLGPDGMTHKHIATVAYEEIVLTCENGMSASFFAWVTSSIASGRPVTRSGAIVLTDSAGAVQSRLDFMTATITSVSLPTLSASSKDMGTIVIKLAPERTQRTVGGAAAPQKARTKPVKAWLSSNFKLTIAGLEDACRGVSAVDPVEMDRKLAGEMIGVLRPPTAQNAPWNFHNLVVTLEESRSKPFYDWADSFLVKGNNVSSQTKSGTLELLAPNMTETIGTVKFNGLGICRLGPVPMEANEAVRRVKAEMYCESISVELNGIQ